MNSEFIEDIDDQLKFRNELVRYLSFWPYLLLLLLTALMASFLYLRYATYKYESKAVIEILDPAQDNEMALPTELTVFNRSMINLQNEINILSSFLLHERVVEDLNYNIFYYNVGNVKSTQTTAEEWFKDFELKFKSNPDKISASSSYEIMIEDGNLVIASFDSKSDMLKEYSFEKLTTKNISHDLPFDLTINQYDDDSDRSLRLSTVSSAAKYYRSLFNTTPLGSDSDQLSIKLTHENKRVSETYLNGLLYAFDNDGVVDRQLEYQRTIKFVDEREVILKKELELVELRKQNFKETNNLSNLDLDAGNSIDLKSNYNSEIFEAESQMKIANYLSESISTDEYNYLPINIGIENFNLTEIIADYNQIISNRNRFLNETGPNNALVKSLEKQLDDLLENISNSLQNYLNSLEIKLNNLIKKELEFENVYNTVPENEKTLRSIERELSIKEALYLLLLQKREEAAINLAVVKPTIKIIDYPISDKNPISPRANLIYLGAIAMSIFTYLASIYIWFSLDNKIHNKSQLVAKLNKNIPVINEIPYINDESELIQNKNSGLRSLLSESIRMLISNLKYVFPNLNNSGECKTLIFTSSIKGEGKTLASVNTAVSMSADLNTKVILIGADLRNPQIHKNFGLDKDRKGLSEIIYNNDVENYKSYLNKYDNLDFILSGSIPPNPTSMLSGKTFENLILRLKKDYEYIIIDSAPCLLVSDTFQIIKYVDTIIYMFRANFTTITTIEFINELYEQNKITNINVVLNAVGNSAAYGYKYGYQYGYQYGYKYGYNYGYGYGYGSNQNEEKKQD